MTQKENKCKIEKQVLVIIPSKIRTYSSNIMFDAF